MNVNLANALCLHNPVTSFIFSNIIEALFHFSHLEYPFLTLQYIKQHDVVGLQISLIFKTLAMISGLLYMYIYTLFLRNCLHSYMNKIIVST